MIKIFPTSQAQKHIKELLLSEFRTRKGIRKALFDIGLDSARAAEMLINNSGKSGLFYIVNGLPHQASAPGEAPANMSGKLKRSMNYAVHGYDEVEFGAGSEAPYAKYLEGGTERIEQRPFLSSVVRTRGQLYAEFLGQEVDREIKRRS